LTERDLIFQPLMNISLHCCSPDAPKALQFRTEPDGRNEKTRRRNTRMA